MSDHDKLSKLVEEEFLDLVKLQKQREVSNKKNAKKYGVLDKLPEDFFEKAEAMKTMRAQQRAPTRTMLGLGRDRPIPPAQKTDDEIKYESTVIPQEVSKDKKMFCVKCGLELEHDAVFCANCGEPNPYIKK